MPTPTDYLTGSLGHLGDIGASDMGEVLPRRALIFASAAKWCLVPGYSGTLVPWYSSRQYGWRRAAPWFDPKGRQSPHFG